LGEEIVKGDDIYGALNFRRNCVTLTQFQMKIVLVMISVGQS